MMRFRLPLTILLSLAAGFATLALTPPSTLSIEDKQAILDLHNDLRSQVALGDLSGQPGAADMEHLLWDDGLAGMATDYASKCIWGHNGNRNDEFQAVYASKGRVDLSDWSFQAVGENIYASTVATPDIELLLSAIDGRNSWFAENVDYTFGTVGGTAACPGAVCGHYTQIVWADTRYLGCGFSTCPSLDGWPAGRTIFVCNYFPAGNVGGFYPYQQSAEACSACSPDRESVCTDGLCAGCDFDDPLNCLDVPVPEPALSLQMLAMIMALAGIRAGRRTRRR